MPEATEKMMQAEAAVDEFGERVGQWVAQAGHRMLRMAARSREEVEDMWAEAQSIRERSGPAQHE